MSKRIYLVKNLTPWMMDELKAFAGQIHFTLLLLRDPPDFYSSDLQELREKGIEIWIKPFAWSGLLSKVGFGISFVFQNMKRFDIGYNSVIGIKSLYWFVRMDMKLMKDQMSIHAQFATQPALLALMLKKYFKDKPKLSFTFHAYDIYFKNTWFDLLVKESLKSFSISDFNLDYVREKFISSDQLVLSRLGVFRSGIPEREFKKSDKTFTLGLMSWFVEKKGIMYLLEAVKALRKNGHENFELRLAGDGPLSSELKKFVDRENLQDHVRFLGKIKGQQKIDFYRDLDAFVLPSVQLKNDQDGIPVVLMEAIAFGLPIISTSVSGIPEICKQGFNGELVPERNVEELTKAIQRLFEDPVKRRLYAENSLLLSKEYDIENNSKNKIIELQWTDN